MTDKQKQVVALLGRLIKENKINDEEYMLLMENVLEERQIVYYPTYPTYPTYMPEITRQDFTVTSNSSTVEDLFPHKEYQGG